MAAVRRNIAAQKATQPPQRLAQSPQCGAAKLGRRSSISADTPAIPRQRRVRRALCTLNDLAPYLRKI
jgi:hypothetical protein